ncbi:hypothetical protein BVG16_27350 [Paenibacillus selenitireducens]|uniref:N-acetyltransferase domain-containing protein n=1 Tax=Paenibacillus selenitireducens TaxID=1324314 RepID=A0A1T2X1V9_9BACL|nr:hypothetical protein BVG16_27350 [Paenibacillus selenitireducens]
MKLKPITDDNRKECLDLKPHAYQEKFVAPNSDSLKKAEKEPSSKPYGIYSHEEMVGFALFDEEPYPDDGYFWIIRFMVDGRFQKMGYGRAALGEIIRMIRSKQSNAKIRISHVPDNSVVNKLYKEFGFVETGEIIHGETVLDLIVES